MANKKIEIRPVGDGDFGDVLFPKTSADMVIDEVNGGTLQEHLNDTHSHIPYVGSSSGSANTYTVSVSGVSSLTEGLALSFKANHTNTTNAVLNVNSLGIKNIRDSKNNLLTANKIVNGGIYTVRYNGTDFFLQGAEGGEYGTATAAEVMSGYTVGTENGVVNGSLTLRGDAEPHFVLTGRNYYTTDPKTVVRGTMPYNVNTTTTGTRRASAAGYIDLSPALGYYDATANSKTRISDSNFTAANIMSGVSVFGLSGTGGMNYYTNESSKYFTSGYTSGSNSLTLATSTWNCGFRAKYVVVSVSNLPVPSVSGGSLNFVSLLQVGTDAYMIDGTTDFFHNAGSSGHVWLDSGSVTVTSTTLTITGLTYTFYTGSVSSQSRNVNVFIFG